jgi:TolB-like protein
VLHRIGPGLLLAAALVAGPAASSAAPARVAVLPVVIHSLGDEAYLREGLADMLASRLGQSPALAVVRVEDPAQATTDLERARAAARGAGAEYVLFGSFTHFGEGASLDLSCARVSDAGAPPAQIFIQTGTIGEIIPKLDDLARRVAAHVAAGGVAPPVSAGPPGATGVSSLQVLDALSELDSLSARVDGLEQRVYGNGAPPAPAPTGDPAATPPEPVR